MRLSLFLMLAATLSLPAAQTVLVLTTEGRWVEGATTASKAGETALSHVLSMHNGAPASAQEAERIATGFKTLAIEDLTNIGLPVLTPLLKTLKDTDQHEPKPLYNLFDRIVSPGADQADREASLWRLDNAAPTRGAWPKGDIKIGSETIPWPSIRMLAVRRKSVARRTEVHSLRHSTQIEYLDAGVYLGTASQLKLTAIGFTRLSWFQDEWATGPNGLTKPGPNYKTNLVDGHPFGALLGRVTAKGEVFFLGASATKDKLGAGRLHLAINDNKHWQNNVGSYVVSLSASDAYDLGAPR